MLVRVLVAAAVFGATYDAKAQTRWGCGDGENRIECRAGAQSYAPWAPY